jgi:hypothetical protein
MVNIGRLTILARFTLLVLTGVAPGLPASPVRAAVIWTFDSTSCTAVIGFPCTLQPGELAQLALPDINSSGTWSGFFNASTHTFTETGDTNFVFQLIGSSLEAPDGHPGGGFEPAAPLDMEDNIEFDIAFASSPASLSITAIYTAAFNDVCIQQGTLMVPGHCNLVPPLQGSFLVGSDLLLVGCSFSLCEITGNWALALVPEPSSFASLASSLLGFLTAILLLASRRNGVSLVPLIRAERT